MGLDDHHTRSGIRCGYFRQILSLQFRSLRMLGVRNRSSSSIPPAITENPRVRKSGVMDGGVRSSVLGGELW